MEYLIAPYIYPIMKGDETIGQGFVSDGYFFTAAHVVKDNPMCFVELGGKRIQLSSINPRFIGNKDADKDLNHADVAIYKFGDSDSPLNLNIQTPKPPERYKSCCVQTHFDTSTNTYNKIFTEIDATVVGEEGNYFYCRCKRFLGSSGSPLLWGNQVVGVMHGGIPKDELCAFLKVESFIFETDIVVIYNKMEIINRLFPYGCDRTMAIVILYALHTDVNCMGVNLAEEKINETDYYAVLERLSFNIYELKKFEKDLLVEYCMTLI